MSYDVRLAGPEDLAVVFGLMSESRGPVNAWPDVASDRQRAMWDRMMGSDGLSVYLAESPEEPVATAALQVMPSLGYDCRPAAFIEAVVVAIAHRRRGAGRALMQRVLEDCRAQGCHKVQLLSHRRHAADGAYDFYHSLGFTQEAAGFRLYL
jgi:GNAT superfamily N-acetyltransferase